MYTRTKRIMDYDRQGVMRETGWIAMENKKEAEDSIKTCIKIAACVCGKDGVISSAEEKEMLRLCVERYPKCDQNMFESTLTEFFDADDQIEDYVKNIEEDGLRKFALELAETSASADGLALRENIALEKVYMIWGIDRNA